MWFWACRAVCRLVAAVLVAGCVLAGGSGPVGAQPSAEAAADAYMRGYQHQTGVPGLAFAIVRGDRVVHSRAWGEDGDGVAVTAQTPFLLGSVAKPFTALAVAQLAEAGRIDLDARVVEYVPWFRLADQAVSARITVRHLLTHTSGLPRWAARTDRFDNSTGGLARSVRDLATVRADGAPGRRHQYSDANYMVLGVLVETVAGQPFGVHLRRAVLDPLRMRHAAATAAEAEAVDLPAGHRFYLGRPLRFDPPYDTSGVPYGYLAASLDDLTGFVTAQLRGGQYGSTRLLSAKGVAETHTGQAGTGSGRYGLGWRESTLDGSGDRVVWHAGATPGYFSHLVVLPGADLGVVVLANAYSPGKDGRLAAAAFNLARIIQSQPTREASTDPLFTIALTGLLATIGCLLGVLVWWAVRAVRRTPARPATTRRAIAGTTGWLAACTALIVGAAWAMPASMGGSLGQAMLWTPDLAHAAIAVVVLAATVASIHGGRTIHTLVTRRRAS